MRNMIPFIILCSMLSLLTGCWGQRDIPEDAFVSSLGLDYKKGEFELYIQGMNFGSIAKKEGVSKQLPFLLGEAKGVSIQKAFNTLQESTAMPLHLGHLQSIIVSENVLKSKIPDVMHLIGESPLIRYNILMFGTNENIKDVMQSDIFFNISPLNSILFKPDYIISRDYIIPVLRYNQFTSRYYRQIGSILIPSLTLDENHFSEDKAKKVLVLNGEYIVSQQQYKGWLSKQNLNGIKWFSKGIENTLSVGTEKVAVFVKNTRAKIEVLKGDRPTYKVIVKGNAFISTNVENKNWHEIEKELNEQIKTDILMTIKKGVEKESDVLNISEKAYKYHLNDWDVNTIRDLNVKSITEVEVKMHIKQSGAYKR